jgi:hypothetical protein
MRYLLKSICFISTIGALIYAAAYENLQWKGKIEYKDGVKVIKNSKEPIYGEITLELEEDLIIGNDVDENYMFFRGVSAAVDSEQNIYVRDSGNYRVQGNSRQSAEFMLTQTIIFTQKDINALAYSIKQES